MTGTAEVAPSHQASVLAAPSLDPENGSVHLHEYQQNAFNKMSPAAEAKANRDGGFVK